ncbi:serpin-ZX-like [Neltuma alba]|uniref:serpin-ZX-like n=1 Tax=Neltuma alba TaxID=207710 RepID=UPI0010A426D2|nr:serpin-ZX-like [Prosopis alba]
MQLNLLHLRNRLFISPWLERSVLSFSFCPFSANQTASYGSRSKAGGTNKKRPTVFHKSMMFGNHLLVDGEMDENRVLSPLSFQVVLSLLAAGSGGYTRRQLLTFFDADSVDQLNHFASRISEDIMADGDPAVGPRMRCSNGLWLDQSLTLKPSFKQILDSDYRAALNPVDFQTKAPNVRQQINSWVENETNGLVKDLIREGSLNNSVKLVFTNALYFKGAWDEDESPPLPSTEDRRNENFTRVPFMIGKRREFGRWYDGFERFCQVHKKQSEDRRCFSMAFCYPLTHTGDGCIAHVTETVMDVRDRSTPKFSCSSEVEASSMLRGLRVTLPFSGGRWKEMLNSFTGPKLYVFSILQKSFMETNEQGTEAATATTAILMSGCPACLPHVPKMKFIDRIPFLLYAGKDEYGGILMAKIDFFIMQVVNPLPI